MRAGVEKVNAGWRLPLSNPSSHYRARTIDASIRSAAYFFAGRPPGLLPQITHAIAGEASESIGSRIHPAAPVNLLGTYQMTWWSRMSPLLLALAAEIKNGNILLLMRNLFVAVDPCFIRGDLLPHLRVENGMSRWRNLAIESARHHRNFLINFLINFLATDILDDFIGSDV